MAEAGIKIIASRNFIDESFLSDRPERYDLFIYAGKDELSCTLAERASKKFIAIESWDINSGNKNYAEALEEIYSNSFLLKPNNYRRVIFCSGFMNSTLIPNPLYDPSTAEEQLKFSHNVGTSDEILTDELRQVEARNVYSIPENLYQTITKWFPGVEVRHTATALIEFLLSVNKNSMAEKMVVNVHHHFIELIVTRGKEILYFNYFNFESPEELVYYILFICEQLHLNPENVDLQFAGIIHATDSSYALTQKYIRNISFVQRPENYTYSSGLNSVPAHFHLNLFSQLVCAL
jgi:hypothetical protein